MNSNWYFTKKERVGLLSLVLISILVYVSSLIFSKYHQPKPYDHHDLDSIVNGMKIYQPKNSFSLDEHQIAAKKSLRKSYINRILFDFDPNTLSFDSLLLLGISEIAAKNLKNYLSKGGKIRKAEDFMKIWGIRPEDSVLLNYIVLHSSNTSEVADTDKKSKVNSALKLDSATIKRVDIVEINSADTFQLQLVSGIGPKLAARIWKYRERLGGFYDLDQLFEVYGLDEQKVSKIKPFFTLDGQHIRKIKINNTNVEQLGRHPYLDFKRARIILNYIKNHGYITSPQDLEKVKILSEKEISKLTPYLDFSFD